MIAHNAPDLLFKHVDQLRLVLTDEEIEALEKRNQERRELAIAELGERWVGVPKQQ